MTPRKRSTWRNTATLMIILLSGLNQAYAGQKVALVIGNSQYQAASDRLANPVNDAKAVAAQLQSLGYDTQTLLNANLSQMLEGLNNLSSRVARDDTVVFYYAGHGVQLNERNYLVPTDASMQQRDMVARQAISIQDVVDKIDQAGALNRIIILDACRNDPFPKTYRSGTRGLGREQLSTSTGTMIMYAASANEVADDGRGQNGTFTHALLQGMRKNGLRLPEMMDDVREQVRRQTGGRQNPYYEGTGLSRFMFLPAPTQATPQPQLVRRDNIPATDINPPNPTPTDVPAAIKDPWLGVNLRDIDNGAGGIAVSAYAVTHDAPAHKAGIVQGDVIVSYNGQSVTGTSQLIDLIKSTNSSNVSLTIQRSYKQIQLPVTLESRPTAVMTQGTWLDPKTKMMWMRCSLGQTWTQEGCTGSAQTYTPRQAQAAITAMNSSGGYGGYTDWVIPHVEDLAGLIRCDQGFNSNMPPLEIPAKRGGMITIRHVCNDKVEMTTGGPKVLMDRAIFSGIYPLYVQSSPSASPSKNGGWSVSFMSAFVTDMFYGKRDIPQGVLPVRAAQ